MKRKHSEDNDGDGVSKKKSRREKVVLYHIYRDYICFIKFV